MAGKPGGFQSEVKVTPYRFPGQPRVLNGTQQESTLNCMSALSDPLRSSCTLAESGSDRPGSTVAAGTDRPET